MNTPYKFGHLFSADASTEQRYEYPDVWATEPTNGGGSRLVIAPARNQLDVLLQLAERMTGPFWILHVLLVPRDSEQETGRYQCPQPQSLDSVRKFLLEFRSLIEGDARHHLWIGSASTHELLVYDNHNVIYAYGPPSLYTPVLEELGLLQTEAVRFPVPHTHNYNVEFDEDEARLLSYWEWRRTPLQESDNQ